MAMRTLLSAAVSLAALAPAAFAETESDAGSADATPRDVIYVYGVRGSYAETESNSATRTPTALEDLPQSLFVITRDVIDDQAMTGLGELVRYVPGVTMGQGEGHRDAPVFRGNITTSDFFVDGQRDDLQYLRDLYSVERVDVIKGPSALVFGRGTGGGAINRVSKTAGGDVRSLDLSLGTMGQARAAVDLGGEITGSVAGRLNAVIEDSESFRDDVQIERRGIAPTLAFDLSPDTRLDLFAEHFEDDRTVDRGVPSQNGRPWPGDEAAFFGNPDISYSDIEVNTARAVLSHDFTGALSFRGALSYGDYTKFYQNAYAGGPVDAVAGTVPISSYNAATTRENLLLQGDLVWQGAFAGLQHTVLFAVEAGRQDSENLRVNAQSAVFDLADRGRTFQPDFTVPAARDNLNELGLTAVLVQDQIEITDSLKAVAGLRWDRFDLDFIDQRAGQPSFSRTDEFVSPKLGLIYEPVAGLSLYAGWSQAYLPQSGDQFSSLNLNTATLEPEEFENTELGLRWRLAPELLVSAALYRLDRTNATAPGAVAGTLVLTGSQRSEGLELSVQGEVREGWNVIGALAVQNSEITSTTASAPAGREAPLVPDFSASVWNRVAVTDRFELALGVIHQSEQFASITNAVELPAYTRVDAAAFFTLTDRIDLQLNIENVLDETYWFSAHNDNNISPGAPTNARLTLSASF